MKLIIKYIHVVLFQCAHLFMQRLNSDIEAGEKLITQRLTILERLISYGFYWRDPEDVIEILIHILKKEVHVQSTGNSLCCCVISNMVACCLSRLFIVTKIVYLCVEILTQLSDIFITLVLLFI